MVPQAEYGFTLTSNVMVPMRDGVRLAGDLYRPAQSGAPLPGRWPTILIRTPYDKTDLAHLRNAGPFWAGQGYACFIQDCRGRYASEGTFYKYIHEPEDGFDTVEWLAAQDWCDGNVGTSGVSYLCHTQTAMAPLRPPHLKAMFCLKGGFFNAHTSCVRQGGAFELRQVVWAFVQAGRSQEARRSPVVKRAFETTDLAAWLLRYPFKRGYSPLSPAPAYERYLWDLMEHEDYSDYWKQMSLNAEEHLQDFADVPTLFLSGWYDIYARSTVQFFENLSTIKTAPIKLIMGPWAHEGLGSLAGEVEFGPQASLEGEGSTGLAALQVKWFDRWLKGERNGVEAGPPVHYFTMGGGSGRQSEDGFMSHGGQWRTASAWPPAGASYEPFYLQSGSALAPIPPAGSQDYSGYQYDPRDPVPTLGGNMIRHENILWPGAYDQRERPEFFLCRPPYLPLAARRDVLVFRTPPLEQDLEVTGAVRAVLYVSSSAVDTDFTVKLVDEYPPNEDYPRGFAMNVTHGIIRCRYRNSRDRAELMEPGKVYQVAVELYPTSNRFARGHRLRIDVASSNYPHFDLNPNTGEPFGTSQRLIVADNRAYHDRSRPSHVLLPVVR